MTRARLPVFRLEPADEQAIRDLLGDLDADAFITRARHVMPLHIAALQTTDRRRERLHAELRTLREHALGLLVAVDPLSRGVNEAIRRHLAPGVTPEDLAWPLVDRLRSLATAAEQALADCEQAPAGPGVRDALLRDLERLHAESGGAAGTADLPAVASLLLDACHAQPDAPAAGSGPARGGTVTPHRGRLPG